MTDFEKYKQLFSETDVTFKVNSGTEYGKYEPFPSYDWIFVEQSSGDNPIVDGYCGFYNRLKFNKQTGKLLEFGIWE